MLKKFRCIVNVYTQTAAWNKRWKSKNWRKLKKILKYGATAKWAVSLVLHVPDVIFFCHVSGGRTHLCRDENGRKRSVNTKTITVFIFFYPKTKSKTVTP
jgi:hypothetical protein